MSSACPCAAASRRASNTTAPALFDSLTLFSRVAKEALSAPPPLGAGVEAGGVVGGAVVLVGSVVEPPPVDAPPHADSANGTKIGMNHFIFCSLPISEDIIQGVFVCIGSGAWGHEWGNKMLNSWRDIGKTSRAAEIEKVDANNGQQIACLLRQSVT